MYFLAFNVTILTIDNKSLSLLLLNINIHLLDKLWYTGDTYGLIL